MTVRPMEPGGVRTAAVRSHRELDAGQIVATLERLQRRIDERFPGSGLSRVCAELLAIGRESAATAADLGRPRRWLRAGVVAAAMLLVASVVHLFAQLNVGVSFRSIGEVLQALEAAVNDLVFGALAIFFLANIETRLKRTKALRALHELRSVAHIIDMHQLTKDPEQALSGVPATPSSPLRTMTRFELARYLDYCSEMLSLTSKLAAVHVQHFNDPVVLDTVNDVETLTTGLSRKIWQKIMIIDVVGGETLVRREE